MSNTYTSKSWIAALAVGLLSLVACSRSIDTSVAQARQHVSSLVPITHQDVEELHKGLPDGAQQLRQLYQAQVAPKDDLENVRKQLDRTRNHVQDLRVAKSTFFVVAERDGTILRSDREPDLMGGKNLFTGFPEIRQSLEGKVVTTRGEMPEAAGVKGRRDGQYVVSVPIASDTGVSGIYASGWSWAAYAYRLQNALQSEIRAQRKNELAKEPLIYVYVVVAGDVFGAPTAPEVNAEAIKKLDPLSKLSGDAIFATPIEITGRDFGLALGLCPSLGPKVAVAVLRSET